MDVKIRILKKEITIKACAAIAYENWPDERRVARHIVHELKNPEINFLVAETIVKNGKRKHKEIVGWAAWCWSAISYDVAEFVWCNIRPLYQRQGIGKSLTHARLEAIRKHDGRIVVLTTGHPEVYVKYGFKTIGIYDLWIGPQTHLMAKELV